MAEADRARVFDRFYRGADTSDRRSGSGLGLAIARQILESHDGRIRLESRGGAGSTFVLWSPERAVDGVARRLEEPPAGDPMR
ncbi:sensor histidine kinase [Curtobacterium sp. 20TX0008]|uniref:sensor histidine kinase n=1 Tax=Curtobacterium sp. 20TX0008 TaxID=3022018 RepID=UPI003FA4B438